MVQIVDLKAALFSKRNEAAREKRKQQDDGLVTRKVSDKVKLLSPLQERTIT